MYWVQKELPVERMKIKHVSNKDEDNDHGKDQRTEPKKDHTVVTQNISK